MHRVPRQWGRGHVTLLGDAAHAFPPSRAQGANQALEDAWLLRRTVCAGADEAGLRAYERVSARRVAPLSRRAASEVTDRPAPPGAALLGRLVAPRLAGVGYFHVLRRWSSVLRDAPDVPEHGSRRALLDRSG